MSFIELLTIGLIIGLLAFGGALIIIGLLELVNLTIGFCKYNKLQKKIDKLEQQKQDLDFEKLQSDLEHWTKLLEQ